MENTITTNDLAATLAGSDWQSYCTVAAVRHGDRSESEVHVKPVSGDDWDHILVWRVMYRAPHDKRRNALLWPRQVVTSCGFAHSKEDAEMAARAAIRAHTK